ncbi:MAG: S-methyl-5-thioribose-1-phosphate isomerase [Acidimicrobiaceae bacterium]|nr:S-methyl-5-thioribose-1-phosphate isomerase [Acidimicrobiaceae bacterium]
MSELGGRTLDWVDGAILMVDQTKLPTSVEMLRITAVSDLVDAIRRLSVRGAPAIGVAGAFGVALAANANGVGTQGFEADVESIRSARPTAVNLAKMVDRVVCVSGAGPEAVLAEAMAVRNEELLASLNMGERGADLMAGIAGGANSIRALTICNTGGLASVERGTALAVIQTLHERGCLEEAIALETRPLLQGARLTAWELQQMAAPFRLIVDSAGPHLISRGFADVVLAGADRIAANGDTANKIGTFSLALAARHSGVPFVIVAPESTIDMATACGGDIQIENRGDDEVICFGGVPMAPEGTRTINPAFDVTPSDLITAIVTDTRVVRLDQGETLDTVRS